MAREPESLILTLLREMRTHIDHRFGKVDGDIAGVRADIAASAKRIESLRQAMIGESVLGRYTVAEVEERLDAIEKRLSTLEKGAGKKPPTPRKPAT